VGRHNSLEKEEVAMVGLLNRERWLNISTPEHRWHLDKMNPYIEKKNCNQHIRCT